MRLLGDTVFLLFRRGANIRNTISQMANLGVNSMPIVLITVAFSGMVLAYQTAREFVTRGASDYVGWLVAITMAREAAPVLSALVVAARVGSAIAAEIGSMKITEQIDALRALAVNPIYYLVVPRVLACVVMLPVLTIYSDVVGVAGGYVVAVHAGVNPVTYVGSIRAFLGSWDVVGGLMKTVVFGTIVGIVSCHQGLKTTAGAAGVGRSTTNSVVLSIIFVYAVNYFLNLVVFGRW